METRINDSQITSKENEKPKPNLSYQIYNPELRALLSVRNFNAVLEKHYTQLLQIEQEMDKKNKTALAVIEANCSPEAQVKWKAHLKEIDDAIFSINQILNAAKVNTTKKDHTDSSVMWKPFELYLIKLKEEYKDFKSLGFEILPESVHKHWEKDICNFESTMLALVISYAEVCRVELQLIERYMPDELDKITQIILKHIPDDFTFEEVNKYEKDYLSALDDFKQELQEEKNLWDTFLDILAGGTHQSPNEHVMMERWIEGERGNL